MQVSDLTSTVTLICCFPGASVNTLKPREKRDPSESSKDRVRGKKGKLSQFNSLLEIRSDKVMNEHTPKVLAVEDAR